MVDFKDLVGEMGEEDKQEHEEKKKEEVKETGRKVTINAIKPRRSLVMPLGVLFSLVGLAGVGALWFFYGSNEGIMTVTLILGGIFYAPLGLVIGAILFNPTFRLKALRSITRKNYGLIGFVSRGKQIKQLVRNLDNDFVWIGDKVWRITEGNIYWYDSNSTEHEAGIKEYSTYTAGGVPILYIDIDNLTPLSFNDTATPLKPQQLGASLKGWAAAQKAKAVLTSTSFKAGIFIALIASAAAAVVSFLAWQNTEQIVQNQQQIIDLIQSAKPVVQQAVTQGGG